MIAEERRVGEIEEETGGRAEGEGQRDGQEGVGGEVEGEERWRRGEDGRGQLESVAGQMQCRQRGEPGERQAAEAVAVEAQAGERGEGGKQARRQLLEAVVAEVQMGQPSQRRQPIQRHCVGQQVACQRQGPQHARPSSSKWQLAQRVARQVHAPQIPQQPQVQRQSLQLVGGQTQGAHRRAHRHVSGGLE